MGSEQVWPNTLGFPASQSVSMQFAQANQVPATAGFSYVTASGVTETLLGSTQALIAVIDVPWARYGKAADEVHYILGNDWRDTPLGGGMHLRVDAANLYTTQRELVFKIANDGGQTRTGTLTLTDTMPDTPRQLTICISSDGTDLSLRAYSAGVSVGTVVWDGGLTAFSGTTLDGSGFLIACTGSGSSLALTPYAAGARSGFDGSIRFLGLYNGAVSNANLISVSNGQAPEDVLTTAANWIIGREFADYTAAVPAASWATADTRGDWALTGTMLPGGDLTPAYSSGDTLSLDPINDGTVWGMAPGETSVSVPLSGQSSGLTGGVEARLISSLDGEATTDWVTVTGASLTGGGAWSGTATFNESTRGWDFCEVRAASSPTMLQRSRAHCGVGWVIGAGPGQSQLSYAFSIPSGDALSVTGSPNVSAVARFYNSSPTDGSLFVDRVTNAVPISDGFAGAASEAATRYGKTPIMIMALDQVGTGPAGLQNDGDTSRSWAEAPGRLVELTSNRVSAFAGTWDTSIPDFNIESSWDALISGTPSTWTISGTNYLHSSFFHHGANAGIALLPSVGTGTSDASIDREIYQQANGGKFWQYSQELERYAVANGWVVGFDPVAAGDLDAGHAETNEGKDLIGRAVLASGMKACGVDASVQPSVTGATWGVGTVDVTVNLPLGGDLTVGALVGSPSGADANPVQGLEIQDITGVATSSRSGFTTSITDSGTGTPPSREATIRITKDSGDWDPGTVLLPFPGMGPWYNLPTKTHELWNGWPRESGNALGGRGFAVPTAQTPLVKPIDPEIDLGGIYWCAVDDATKFFQERTGASATTAAGDGDPVGTVVVSTPSGDVYMTAPSDAARPTRRKVTQAIDDWTHLTYRRIGAEVWFLEFDGTDDEIHSATPFIPDNSNSWTFGMAVASTTTSGNRHVVSQADNLPANSGAWVVFMNVASNLGPFGSHWRAVWKDASPEIQDPPADVQPRSGSPQETSWMHVNTASENKIVTRGNSTVDTFTAGSTEGVAQENLGFGQSPQTAMLSHGAFRLYGFFVSDEALTETQQKQAQVWLGQRYGQIPPYW